MSFCPAPSQMETTILRAATFEANGTYVVAPGDDLYEMAKRFGTTVVAIGEANALTSNKIEAGATLQIPN